MTIFRLAVYLDVLIASVLLWKVAAATGKVANVKRFPESFGWETFAFNGGQLFRNPWVIGLLLVFLFTGLGFLGTTVFISSPILLVVYG